MVADNKKAGLDLSLIQDVFVVHDDITGGNIG